MRFYAILGVMALAAAGCTLMNHSTQAHHSSSLVSFLYPDGSTPPPQNAVPELRGCRYAWGWPSCPRRPRIRRRNARRGS